MTLNEWPSDASPPSPPTYVPINTTRPSAYSRNNIDSESFRRQTHAPVPQVSSSDLARQEVPRHHNFFVHFVRERCPQSGEFRRPRLSLRPPQSVRLPAPPGWLEDSIRVPAYSHQQIETTDPTLDIGDGSHQPQPVVPEVANSSDLDVKQGVTKKESDVTIMVPRVDVAAAAIIGIAFWIYCILWPLIALQTGIMKLIMFSTLLGSPYFVLNVFLSRSRECKDDRESQEAWMKSTSAIAFFHCLCGVGLAIFGAYMQYKYDAF